MHSDNTVRLIEAAQYTSDPLLYWPEVSPEEAAAVLPPNRSICFTRSLCVLKKKKGRLHFPSRSNESHDENNKMMNWVANIVVCRGDGLESGGDPGEFMPHA